MIPSAFRLSHRGQLAVLSAVVIALLPLGAAAQSVGSPSAYFHHSTLTGSGATITAARVPVSTPGGKIVFRDVTLQLEADADGNLMLASGFPVVVQAPELPVLQFQAGKYLGPRNIANGKAVIRVGGPSASPGGGSVWSLLSSDDADRCTYPGSATWYVGPLENSPQAARLKRAGITSTAWSYGVSGVGPGSSCLTFAYTNWDNGSLIGVSQSGNTLTIASFTNTLSRVTGTDGVLIYDRSAPVDQVTYILAP